MNKLNASFDVAGKRRKERKRHYFLFNLASLNNAIIKLGRCCVSKKIRDAKIFQNVHCVFEKRTLISFMSKIPFFEERVRKLDFPFNLEKHTTEL